jgi:uncharacterized protein
MDTTPWWRQRWPWLLMLGPFVVLLAGAYTGWLAFSRPDALVVGDYYKRGKAINQDLRRDRAARQLGVTAVLRYDAARGALTGKFDSNSAVPATVVLRLAHATQPDKDVVLELHPAPDGVFDAALPMLERTRWQVLVESAARDWRLEGRWHWPEQREITLSAPNT